MTITLTHAIPSPEAGGGLGEGEAAPRSQTNLRSLSPPIPTLPHLGEGEVVRAT